VLAFCGIDCTSCPVCRATIDENDILKVETAEKWSKEFGFIVQKSDMNCLGCRSKILFKLCIDCPFRSCSLGKGIDNCGQCSEYPCVTLNRFLRSVPEARERLKKVNEQYFGGKI